ncbi:MAG: hypothetical protein AB1611_14465 [bacterium]
MEILSQQPEQRLSRTEFDQIENSHRECSRSSIYTCPVCKQETPLALTDFTKNCLASSASSYCAEGSFYRLLFDRTAQPEKEDSPAEKPEKLSPQKGNSKKEKGILHKEAFHLDFQCSGCHQPVRIEYVIYPSAPCPGFPYPDFPHSGSPASPFLRVIRVLEIVLPLFPPHEELLDRLNRVVDFFYSLSIGQPAESLPYLWLVAVTLFPYHPPYDDPAEAANIFFLEKQKLESIIGWSFAWEWIDESQAALVRDQFSLWLAMIIKFNQPTEEAVVRMLRIADLLQNLGLEKRYETLALALALTLENCPDEQIRSRVQVIARLKKNSNCPPKADPSWDSLLMLVLGDESRRHHLWPINKILKEKNYLLAERDRRLASVLLSLQGQNPQGCVDRFTKVAEAFNQALASREESLVDPAFFPVSEHPFQKVVLSFLNEFSPAFPFDSRCSLPIALLSALPWEAGDLARESIGLYTYLRSYRKFINPTLSFWLSTNLVFSAWEGGNCPYLLLFWFLASVTAAPGFQYQEESASTVRLHRV